MKNIKCADCKYAREDSQAPGNGTITVYDRRKRQSRQVEWIGVQCVNPDSDYYHALLNISVNGTRLVSVTWGGCEYGRCER